MQMCLNIALHIALLYRQEMLFPLYIIIIKKHFITITIKECSIDIIVIKNHSIINKSKGKNICHQDPFYR